MQKDKKGENKTVQEKPTRYFIQIGNRTNVPSHNALHNKSQFEICGLEHKRKALQTFDCFNVHVTVIKSKNKIQLTEKAIKFSLFDLYNHNDNDMHLMMSKYPSEDANFLTKK